jgi:hypothetical protein
MKITLPSAVEVSVLTTLAVLAGAIVPFISGSPGLVIGLMFPLVLTCMLMGARRTGKLDPVAPLPAAAEQSA